MSREASAFNKINNLPKFQFSQADLVRSSGLQKSLVSRFLAGKEVNLSNFGRLINSMPEDFQKLYWREVLPEELFKDPPCDWKTLIKSASLEEIGEILEAISDWWSNLVQSGKFKPTPLIEHLNNMPRTKKVSKSNETKELSKINKAKATLKPLEKSSKSDETNEVSKINEPKEISKKLCLK